MPLKAKKLSLVSLAVFLILAFGSTSYSQGICPISTLKVNRVRGRVLWNDKMQEPISQATVELIRLDETDSLITSTMTDASGLFEITGIQKGLYALEARATINGEKMFRYRIAIKLQKSNDRKTKSLIEIKYGSDCFVSEARVAKTT